jgi:hypothetical protein
MAEAVGVLNAHFVTESRASIPIVKFAIDSGYATPEVYAWTRKYGGARAVVIKGDSRAAAPISQPSPVDVGPQGDRVRWGVRVWPVNGSMIKEELYRWLRLDRPTEESGDPYPPGYCHFPKYGEEYFKQLTAEQLVTKVVKGYRRTEWQKTRDRNEALDVGPTRGLRQRFMGWIDSPRCIGRRLKEDSRSAQHRRDRHRNRRSRRLLRSGRSAVALSLTLIKGLITEVDVEYLAKVEPAKLVDAAAHCRAEIAAIEKSLLSGHPDVAGLCLALSDWSAELRLLGGGAIIPSDSK